MDYRDLLQRYIAWVSSNEGVDFITHGGDHNGSIRTNFFDDEEWLELWQLAEAARSLEPEAAR